MVDSFENPVHKIDAEEAVLVAQWNGGFFSYPGVPLEGPWTQRLAVTTRSDGKRAMSAEVTTLLSPIVKKYVVPGQPDRDVQMFRYQEAGGVEMFVGLCAGCGGWRRNIHAFVLHNRFMCGCGAKVSGPCAMHHTFGECPCCGLDGVFMVSGVPHAGGGKSIAQCAALERERQRLDQATAPA